MLFTKYGDLVKKDVTGETCRKHRIDDKLKKDNSSVFFIFLHFYIIY
jgi:hypothetical protein